MARVLLLDKLLLKWVKFCKFRLSRDGGLFQLLKSETASIFFVLLCTEMRFEKISSVTMIILDQSLMINYRI